MDLVIGIGNRLCGDDAVGATLVESIERPGVSARAVHQLTPDLAAEISQAGRVLFVDARFEDGDGIRLERIGARQPAGIGHAVSPEELLFWARHAFGTAPDGWLLSVPASSFDPGAGLGARTRAALPAARDALERWVERGSGGNECRENV